MQKLLKQLSHSLKNSPLFLKGTKSDLYEIIQTGIDLFPPHPMPLNLESWGYQKINISLKMKKTTSFKFF